VVGLQPMAVTSDLHIVFLRPAAGGDLLARATLLRAGRTRISGRVEVWVEGSEDHPVAQATGTDRS
jgi:acyl-coenzyme A thioesterase PaaI-like protein